MLIILVIGFAVPSIVGLFIFIGYIIYLINRNRKVEQGTTREEIHEYFKNADFNKTYTNKEYTQLVKELDDKYSYVKQESQQSQFLDKIKQYTFEEPGRSDMLIKRFENQVEFYRKREVPPGEG